jgi:PAS domain S-box-containing protein
MESVMRGGAGGPGAALYQLVFENSAIGLVVTDLDGRIHPNQAFAEMLGYQRDELNGMSWKDITHPADIRAGVEGMGSLSSGATTYVRVLKRYTHRTGGIVWGEVTARMHREEDGTPAFLIASVLDVTQRKQVEEELLLRSTILTTEHETLPEGILVVDPHGRVLSYNRRFLEVCKVPTELADARDDHLLLAEAAKQIVDPEKFREQTEAVYRTPLATSHDEIVLKDGRTIDRSSAPMVTQRGENLGRLWCFRDITHAKRYEGALRDKLSELERWQDLMLDREERVGTLKREVNELCSRLGEAPRSPSQEPDATGSGCGPYNVTAEMPSLPEPGGSDGEDR